MGHILVQGVPFFTTLCMRVSCTFGFECVWLSVGRSSVPSIGTCRDGRDSSFSCDLGTDFYAWWYSYPIALPVRVPFGFVHVESKKERDADERTEWDARSVPSLFSASISFSVVSLRPCKSPRYWMTFCFLVFHLLLRCTCSMCMCVGCGMAWLGPAPIHAFLCMVSMDGVSFFLVFFLSCLLVVQRDDRLETKTCGATTNT